VRSKEIELLESSLQSNVAAIDETQAKLNELFE
jgi:hypothetical protein